MFDPDMLRGVLIKWEGDSDVVHGIEPFAHLSPELDRCHSGAGCLVKGAWNTTGSIP